MVICVRDRFSATRSTCVSPTLSWLALSAMCASSALFHRTFRCHADAPRRDHEFPLLVAIFGDALAEGQLPGAPAFAFPRVAGLRHHRQHVARAKRAMIFEVLLRMEPTAAGRIAFDAARCLA